MTLFGKLTSHFKLIKVSLQVENSSVWHKQLLKDHFRIMSEYILHQDFLKCLQSQKLALLVLLPMRIMGTFEVSDEPLDQVTGWFVLITHFACWWNIIDRLTFLKLLKVHETKAYTT